MLLAKPEEEENRRFGDEVRVGTFFVLVYLSKGWQESPEFLRNTLISSSVTVSWRERYEFVEQLVTLFSQQRILTGYQ